MSTLVDEIAAIERAMLRHEDQAEDRFPFDPSRDCCPSCLYGSDYAAWCNRQRRRAEWLAILRRKAEARR